MSGMAATLSLFLQQIDKTSLVIKIKHFLENILVTAFVIYHGSSLQTMTNERLSTWSLEPVWLLLLVPYWLLKIQPFIAEACKSYRFLIILTMCLLLQCLKVCTSDAPAAFRL